MQTHPKGVGSEVKGKLSLSWSTAEERRMLQPRNGAIHALAGLANSGFKLVLKKSHFGFSVQGEASTSSKS